MSDDLHNPIMQTISCDTPEQCQQIAELQKEAMPTLVLIAVVAALALWYFSPGGSDGE